MLEYFLVFLSGIIAHYIGLRVMRVHVVTKAMMYNIFISLLAMKSTAKALSEAHDVIIVYLRAHNATAAEVAIYEEISKTQLTKWREESVAGLSRALSSRGLKWAEWKDWSSAMKFLDSFANKKDGE